MFRKDLLRDLLAFLTAPKGDGFGQDFARRAGHRPDQLACSNNNRPRPAGTGVIKSDAGIEFHVNFCHPNPMKPAMPTLDEKDIVLLQRIKRHPLLRARVESLLGVVEDAGGDLEKADAAERRVIEELRQMGNEVLTEWAQGGIDKCAAQAQEREEVRSGGKKNSTGTRPSAKSR